MLLVAATPTAPIAVAGAATLLVLWLTLWRLVRALALLLLLLARVLRLLEGAL